MKRIIYTTIALLGIANASNAQGFLDKVKNKVTKAIEKKEPAAVAMSATNGNYTDPAKFGKVIMTYSKKEVDAHMGGSDGGFNLWFKSIKVVNNQLELNVVDYDKALGKYSNGSFQRSSEPVDMALQNKTPNGSELYLKSKDFSQIDMYNAMLKKGPSVAGARVPGKVGMAYTFNGKPMGEYMSASLTHNPDSTAVALVGMGFANGAVKYVLATSTGQKMDLPVKITGWPLISADGKIGAAIVQSMAGGTDVYLTNGAKYHTGIYDSNYGLWLHNSGALYYINNANNKELFKNGELFATANAQINARQLFISANDKTACWMGDHGLYFSDETAFENGEDPYKVIINGKEVIVFLDIDIASGNLYLCQHDL